MRLRCSGSIPSRVAEIGGLNYVALLFITNRYADMGDVSRAEFEALKDRLDRLEEKLAAIENGEGADHSKQPGQRGSGRRDPRHG